jgi:thioesterase domain-containing protein
MTDSLAATQAWLYKAFPLVAEMGLEVTVLEPNLVATRVPLERNHNVHGTAFAGSLSAQAMLTGWILLTRFLEAQELDAVLLQREATIRYLAPVTGDPVCRSSVDPERLAAFRHALVTSGKARLDTDVEILDGESIEAVLTAGYSARLKL